MTPEDVKRFETLQDLFSHPGWAMLVEELDARTEAIKEGFTTFGVTETLLAFGQGRISTHRDLTSLPNVIEHALKEQDDVETDPV
jgi:hypothetical protein